MGNASLRFFSPRNRPFFRGGNDIGYSRQWVPKIITIKHFKNAPNKQGKAYRLEHVSIMISATDPSYMMLQTKGN